MLPTDLQSLQRKGAFSSAKSKENFGTLNFVPFLLQVNDLFLHSMNKKYRKQNYLLISFIISLNPFISEDMFFQSDVTAKAWKHKKNIKNNSEEEF